MSKWNYVKLGDVCTIERGGSPRPIEKYITQSEDGINWIKIGDTDNSKYIVSTKQKITNEGALKSRFVRKGDFLLSNSMSFGRPYILKIDGCIHDGWLVIRDNKSLFDKNYLYYYLSSPIMFNHFKSLAVGGVVNNLNSKMVRNVSVALPPIYEQKRIALTLDIISELLSHYNLLIEKINQLIKSRFVEMFGDPIINPHNWRKVPLEELAEIKIGPFGSLLHKEDYTNNGHALVNPSHIKEDKIIVDNSLTVSDEKYAELSAYHLHKNDVVLGRRGEMGRCAVVNDGGLLCGTGSIIIRTNGVLESDYIQKIISFPSFKKSIEDMAVGQTMPNLNVPIVSKFLIICPPMDVQKKYYSFVEQIDKSKLVVKTQIEKLETLKKSLMQEYFG